MARSPSTSKREPLPEGFFSLWSTVAIDLIGFGIVLPILPQYAEQFGASPATIGVLVASFSLAQLVFAPVWGRLSDRIGRKPVLLISLFGTAIGSLLTGLAGSVAVLFAGRIVDGASGASVSVAQAAAADLARPHQRAKLMGLLGAAFGVGFVAGPAIGALGALAGVHVPFLIAAAISFLNALVAIRRLPETLPSARRPVGLRVSGSAPSAGGVVEAVETETLDRDGSVGPLAEMPALDGPGLAPAAPVEGPLPGEARIRRDEPDAGAASSDAGSGGEGVVDASAIVRLILVAFVAMVAFAGFEATFSLLGEHRFGFDLAVTGAVFTAIGMVLVAVQAGLVGPVTHALGERPVLRLGLVANAAGLGLLAFDGGWWTFVPALAFLVVGQGLLTPTLSSSVAGRAGSQRGQWLGWQQSAGGLARVVGPVVAGVLFQQVGVGSPYLVGAALVLVALTLVP